MYLSIIIPAYNEAERIGKTLRAIDEYLGHQSYESEIIVVSDGSTDRTAEVVHTLQKNIQNLTLIDEKINHGKGFAVREGMLKAQGQFALFMDADNSTSIEHVARMLPYFKEGYDVVIGSRRVEGALIAIKQPWLRDFLGGIFRTIVSLIAPVDVRDSQAGFKIFSQKAISVIFKRQTLHRWAFDVELLMIARKHRLLTKEVPITWYNDTQSRMNTWGMMHSLLEFAKIRWNVISGKYK